MSIENMDQSSIIVTSFIQLKLKAMKCSVKSNQKTSKIPCDGCKGHHIKCDKNLEGCANCSRRGISCTYLISRKRRGPKTKVESMMKLLECLNSTNQSSVVTTDQFASTISFDSEVSQCLDLHSSGVSSPMQTTPKFSDDMKMVQDAPVDLKVGYQDIYSFPLFDTNMYNLNLPLPQDLSTFEPSLTIPALQDCYYSCNNDDLNNSCLYSQLNESQFQLMNNLDQNLHNYFEPGYSQSFSNSIYY
ncbi:hypothetical protein CONCODRAFT_3769 [Conidiobolus coronatus NRRL 28638]|uniref:Zn(2)-C6 fungal-type domain-containing protein n=1 Tax=Conidiobolus coronatus (strain ATCC 28846 / CBS 209.66 / NRRL 28638) TaxID=796925 RepID=A0A137PEC4_CONC2|nr:hypothetical protein CONCODRAFT_3769 [Conidiobolus coronatus NRRL 28638]|eukprot:KXN73291.1 hypothetical protein CONCODRAFT_3769 [Conidiobolus coronatus NRRL 28638]